MTFIVKAQIWADRFCNRMNRLITMRSFMDATHYYEKSRESS